MEIDERVLGAVRKFSKKKKLPAPTEELGSGREAVVYESTDPNVAIKITNSMRPYEIIDMQGPGVVKVYRHEEFHADDEKFLVLWMERLQATGWQVIEALGISNEIGCKIESDLERPRRGPIPILTKYKAFRALNALISDKSFPLADMGLRQVGLNSKGIVVVFDL